jgi:hypothetical protein
MEKVILIGIYVDDCLVISKDYSVDELIDELEKNFSLKEERNFVDNLSCNIIEMKEENKFIIVQPHLIT